VGWQWERDGSIDFVSVAVLLVLCARYSLACTKGGVGSYSEYGNSVSENCEVAMVNCSCGGEVVDAS
jgi:hypothetical protein